jgi:hypothetical protein
METKIKKGAELNCKNQVYREKYNSISCTSGCTNTCICPFIGKEESCDFHNDTRTYEQIVFGSTFEEATSSVLNVFKSNSR